MVDKKISKGLKRAIVSEIMKEIEATPKTWDCPYCSDRFMSKKELKAHIFESHDSDIAEKLNF